MCTLVTHQTPPQRPKGGPRQVQSPVTVTSKVWCADDGKINNHPFNPDSEEVGLNKDLIDTLLEGSPIDFFRLIIDDKTSRTNKYVYRYIYIYYMLYNN